MAKPSVSPPCAQLHKR